MKIVLIGPVYPYKGGISHYTDLMYRTLIKRHEVEMVSYSLQYPKVMYRKEQKDYSNKSFEIPDTKFWINTANPINWIRVAKRIRKMKPQAVIMQWWHPYFAPCYFVMAKLLKRIKIMFVCHNVFPHEHFIGDRFLSKMVLRQGNCFLVQSHKDEHDLNMIKEDAQYVVTPHPTYEVFKMKNMGMQEARQQLKIDEHEQVILFFGFVREYKGLKYLIEAMPQIIKKLPKIHLWVVGDFGDDKNDYYNLIEELSIKEYINVVEGYVKDTEVEKYFAAADLVVLPYVSATQSGIVQIAYGFQKPVVVTDVGGLPDVVDDNKTGYVVESRNPNALAEAVIKFYMNSDNNWKENIVQKAKEFSWEVMGEKIDKLLMNTKIDMR